jgi:hypothetical protein
VPVLIITGTGLDFATGVSLGEHLGAIVSATPTELVAQIVVDHGASFGARGVTLTSLDGSASFPDVLEITPFVVTTDGTDAGHGTYEAPYRLCSPELEAWVGGGDTVLLSAGVHECEDSVELAGPAVIAGAGVDATFVQGGTDGVFLGFAIFGGSYPQTMSGLTITTAAPYTAVYVESVTGGTFTLDDARLAGAGLLAAGPGAFTVTDTSIAGCETGVRIYEAATTLDHVTIDSCDVGIQLVGGLPGPSPGAHVVAGDLVDNTTGVIVGEGHVTLEASTIRDDETTPRACTTGVSLIDGDVYVYGGSITGQVAGIDVTIFASTDAMTDAVISDALIEGGEYGVRFYGYPDVATLAMHGSIVRDQTVAAVSWGINEGYADLTGNELSVVSGYALELVASDPRPGDVVYAGGTTLNGNSYSGLVVGPVDVAPDYRITADAQLQF